VNLTSGSNNIDIGNAGIAGESGKIRIGTKATQTATFVAGIYNIAEPVASGIKPVYINSNGQMGTTPPASSARFKEGIKPMDKASEPILALKPVTFHYKNDDEAMPQVGLIAEEVAKVNPNLVVRDDRGEIYAVRYEAVNAMLLNEFLKEHRKVQSLEAKLAQQQKQIETLTSGLQKVSAAVELNKPTPTQVVDNR
jgi:Chaperone of endosialidase